MHQSVREIGNKYQPFWWLNLPRGAILDYITSYGCRYCYQTMVLLFTSFQGAGKDNSGNRKTSQQLKWRHTSTKFAKNEIFPKGSVGEKIGTQKSQISKELIFFYFRTLNAFLQFISTNFKLK